MCTHPGPHEGVRLSLLDLAGDCKRPHPLHHSFTAHLGTASISFLVFFLNLCQQLPFVLDSHILQGGAPSTSRAFSVVSTDHFSSQRGCVGLLKGPCSTKQDAKEGHGGGKFL